MSADADYQAVLADLKKRRGDLDAAILAVEGIIASLGLSTTSTKIRSAEGVPTDAFLSLTIPEAAIKYLGLVRSAQSVAQIWEALKRGGLPHTKYAAVYNALTRREDQVGDIAKLPDSNWGLAEWYPRTPGASRKITRRDRAGRILETAEPEEQGILAAEASPLSIVDASEEILRKVGKPLHATELVKHLASGYGKVTNPKSIAGTLPQDGKKRFKNLGKNVWALKESLEK
jgi:hypothetical protein